MMSLLFSSASVQIIHNSASPTVDIYVDGNLAIAEFEYRMATGILDLPLEFTVGIAPTGGDVIAEFPFSLVENGEYIVVATGLLGNEDTPFNLAAAGTTFGAAQTFGANTEFADGTEFGNGQVFNAVVDFSEGSMTFADGVEFAAAQDFSGAGIDHDFAHD